PTDRTPTALDREHRVVVRNREVERALQMISPRLLSALRVVLLPPSQVPLAVRKLPAPHNRNRALLVPSVPRLLPRRVAFLAFGTMPVAHALSEIELRKRLRDPAL